MNVGSATREEILPSTGERIVLRPARRDDVPAIVRMLADDALGAQRERCEDPLPQPYWDAFERIAAQPANRLIVAEIGGEVVACLQLTLIPGLSHQGMTRALIEAVRVDSARRGQRIGEVVIRDAIERARAEGCGVVQLTSDRSRLDAHRFYERLGFKASHVGMKLKLD